MTVLKKQDKRTKFSKIVMTLSLSAMLTGIALSSHAANMQHRVTAGQTLSDIAKQYDITQTQLINANGLHITYLRAGQVINIPNINTNVIYRVEQGDSLYSLASRFKVDTQTLANINNISPNSKLVVGETLILPKGADLSVDNSNSNTPVTSNRPTYTIKDGNQTCVCTTSAYNNPNPNAGYNANIARKHKVTSGESLIQVARDYGVSTSALANANNLSTDSMIYIGQVLKIPSSSTYYAPQTSTKPVKKAAPSSYKVQSGDGLIKLANKFNISLTNLARYNNLDEYDQLYIGQVLKIPPNATVD